jgi:predicted TPR repeat methyltransferase
MSSELDFRGDWKAAAESVGVVRALLDRPPGLTLAAHRLTLARRFREAQAAYDELLRIEPTNRTALLNVINLLLVQGLQGNAATYRRRLVEVEVDQLGLESRPRAEALAFRLATARLGPVPQRVPADYLARMFDRYAKHYDAHLVGTLGYRGPEVTAAALERFYGVPTRTLDILDLGCGTGLAAPMLRPYAQRLVGVDLSPAMLGKARESGLYDMLDVADMLCSPCGNAGAYDLILVLEVLNYYGDLSSPMRAMRSAIKPGGRLILTVEAGQRGTFALSSAGRFMHTTEYVRETAIAVGLVEESTEAIVLRREHGRDVAGLLFVLSRDGEEPVA